MFTRKELKDIDENEFNVIASDDWNVALQSMETGDRWHILNTECPQVKSSVIFWQNRDRQMVLMGRAKSLEHALMKIVRLEDPVL